MAGPRGCPLVRARQTGPHGRLEMARLHAACFNQEPHEETHSPRDGESAADRLCHHKQEETGRKGTPRRRVTDIVSVAVEEGAGPTSQRRQKASVFWGASEASQPVTKEGE